MESVKDGVESPLMQPDPEHSASLVQPDPEHSASLVQPDPEHSVSLVQPDPEIRPRDKKVPLRQILPRTCCHSLVLLTMGMTISMRGPSFIDLQLLSGTDLQQASHFSTGSSLGYILGSLLTGTLHSRIKQKYLMVVLIMWVSAGLLAAIPWCPDYWTMVLAHTLLAICLSITETTVDTEEVQNWQGDSYSGMQFLNFCYSLGGVMGPLIVKPFLAPKDWESPSSSTLGDIPSNMTLRVKPSNMTLGVKPSNMTLGVKPSNIIRGKTQRLTTASQALTADSWNWNHTVDTNQGRHVSGGSLAGTNVPFNQTWQSVSETSLQSLRQLSRLYLGYMIGGAVLLACSLPLCVFYLWSRAASKSKVKGIRASENRGPGGERLPRCMFMLLTAAISVFYFFFTAIDDVFQGYLPLFLVEHLDWTKSEGAVVAAVFWAVSTGSKLAMTGLVRCLRPSRLLVASCLGIMASLALLVLAGHWPHAGLVWSSTVLMAVSHSAVFGAGIGWADQHLVDFDGRVTSCTMIFSSLGAMVNFSVLGALMQQWSLMVFPYLLLAQACILLFVFLIMLLFLQPLVKRKYGTPRDHLRNQKEINIDVQSAVTRQST